VNPAVPYSISNLKIIGAVILPVTVEMMHDLFSEQKSAEFLFRHKHMNVDVPVLPCVWMFGTEDPEIITATNGT
jgi:hypothetical protein